MQNDPDRVLHLLRRHEDGTFRRVSWETALDPGRPRNRIDPYALHDFDQRTLVTALDQARRVQTRIALTRSQTACT